MLQGFHGLQIYTQMFWYKHLLEYFGCLLERDEHRISSDLVSRLLLLDDFGKAPSQPPESSIDPSKHSREDPRLKILDPWPDLKRFILDIINFRASTAKQIMADESFEGRQNSARSFSLHLTLDSNSRADVRCRPNVFQFCTILLSTSC